MRVKEFEVELLQYHTRQNKERLKELLDDSFIEFAQDGKKYTREEIIDILPQCPEEKIDLYDYIERELSEGVILVNYKIDREVIKSGYKYSSLCSSIWDFNNGKWKMIFFQGTKF